MTHIDLGDMRIHLTDPTEQELTTDTELTEEIQR